MKHFFLGRNDATRFEIEFHFVPRSRLKKLIPFVAMINDTKKT